MWAWWEGTGWWCSHKPQSSEDCCNQERQRRGMSRARTDLRGNHPLPIHCSQTSSLQNDEAIGFSGVKSPTLWHLLCGLRKPFHDPSWAAPTIAESASGKPVLSSPSVENLPLSAPPHWRKAGKEQCSRPLLSFPPMESQMRRSAQVSADCVWNTTSSWQAGDWIWGMRTKAEQSKEHSQSACSREPGFFQTCHHEWHGGLRPPSEVGTAVTPTSRNDEVTVRLQSSYCPKLTTGKSWDVNLGSMHSVCALNLWGTAVLKNIEGKAGTDIRKTEQNICFCSASPQGLVRKLGGHETYFKPFTEGKRLGPPVFLKFWWFHHRSRLSWRSWRNPAELL